MNPINKVVDGDIQFPDGSEPNQKPQEPLQQAPEQPQPAMAPSQGSTIIVDAATEAGPALIQYFKGELGNPSYRNMESLSLSAERFLETLGPYVLQISPTRKVKVRPGTTTSYQVNTQAVGFVTSIDTDVLKEVMTSVLGQHVLNTDLFQNAPQTIKNLDSYLSEFSGFDNAHCGKKEEAIISVHPYILAMALKPEYRPVVFMAISEGLKQGTINPQTVSGNFSQRDQAYEAIIPSEFIFSQAAHYHVRDIKPIIRNINEVMKAYATNWS